MIQLRDVCLDFGGQKVFDMINVTIDQHDRIGLVGRNGSGKSTMLKAVTKFQQLDSGSISVSGKCRIAYLPQEVTLNSNQSIFNAAFSAFKELSRLQKRAHELEPIIQNGDAHAAEEYGEITARLQELSVNTAVRKTKTVLQGLGFKKEQLNDSLTTLSVGWQMRVSLAQLLLQDAEFYLFDEPTNHLDIVAKDWFLEFLKEASFGFVLVCHDRYFLDGLCSKILELEQGKGTLYQGNYVDYEEQKEHDMANLLAAYTQQQKEIKRKRLWINKNKAKASKAKMAKSMERALQKEEIIEIPQQAKSVHFKFGETQRAGRVVLEVTNLSYAYDEKQIFKDVSFQIERGQKVALIAPNGGGKTTLFNVLCGNYKSPTGNMSVGYNVETVIFEQEQHKVLDPRKTVLEEVMDNTRNKTEQQIRTFLGSFLFSKDSVIKKTKVLSGGERNRVSMIKVLLQDANFLLLDEPTNHLDIQSKEILFHALDQFEGTILFVSHDHDFVNKLATRVLELTPNGVHSYFGNYNSFLQQKADNQAEQEVSTENNTHQEKRKPGKVGFENSKQIQKTERKIAKLEKEIEVINSSFADFEYGTLEFSEAQNKLQKKEQELTAENSLWENLQKKN